MEFAMAMTQCEYWMTPGVYDVPVKLTYTADPASGNPVTKTVNVKFTVTKAPVMSLDKEEIRIENATDDHVSVETLKIGNTGEYKLTYSLVLDPTGVGETDEDLGGGIAPRHAEKNEKSSFNAAPFALYEGKFGKKLVPHADEEKICSTSRQTSIIPVLFIMMLCRDLQMPGIMAQIRSLMSSRRPLRSWLPSRVSTFRISICRCRLKDRAM